MGPAPKRRLRRGTIAKATEAQLAELGVDPSTHALAAAALRLAAEADSAGDSKGAATAVRELRQAMAVVVSAAPPKERGDKIDELQERRDGRISSRARKGVG
ncbi:hypothetical protein [Streptomyces sp. NPDC002547]